MMDYIAGLVQRGLISPEAAQNMLAPMQDIAARHQQEGQQVKDTAVDVLSHPQDYIQPGPGGIGMARPSKAFNVGDFKRLYETGMGLDQIAKELGMTDRTLLEARRRAGLLIGKTTDQQAPGQLTRNEVTKIREYFDRGLNNQEIADKYGLSKERILQIRKEWDINPKPRGRPWPTPETSKER